MYSKQVVIVIRRVKLQQFTVNGGKQEYMEYMETELLSLFFLQFCTSSLPPHVWQRLPLLLGLPMPVGSLDTTLTLLVALSFSSLLC
jgi:hypothetical protein